MAEEQEKTKEKLKQNPKKRRKHAFPYGNYRDYYGYRVGQKLVEDPRLKVFKKEWFEGKDCLDIGCNNGIVTIQIARKFNCRSILGVDIDSGEIYTSSSAAPIADPLFTFTKYMEAVL